MKKDNNSLLELENWYLNNCNGDWEHRCGIHVNTLDNPGWELIIDLEDTEIEDVIFTEIDMQKNENDWMQCEVKNKQFHGYGGPTNLIEIINCFLNWAKTGKSNGS